MTFCFSASGDSGSEVFTMSVPTAGCGAGPRPPPPWPVGEGEKRSGGPAKQIIGEHARVDHGDRLSFYPFIIDFVVAKNIFPGESVHGRVVDNRQKLWSYTGFITGG